MLAVSCSSHFEPPAAGNTLLWRKGGKYVRGKIGANTLHSEFVEQNNRHWRSQVFTSALGVKVVVATHPSIADWTTPATDPTPLIGQALRDT